jgi:hypothetical protein
MNPTVSYKQLGSLRERLRKYGEIKDGDYVAEVKGFYYNKPIKIYYCWKSFCLQKKFLIEISRYLLKDNDGILPKYKMLDS